MNYEALKPPVDGQRMLYTWRQNQTMDGTGASLNNWMKMEKLGEGDQKEADRAGDSEKVLHVKTESEAPKTAMAMLATALVTGASRGIGRAIACRLSRDGFGVALNDLPSQKSELEEVHALITQQGGKAMMVFANVTVESEVKQMVKSVVEQMGGLDVMVANAGICVTADFLDTTTEDFQRTFTTNVLGTFLCYKYAAQQMIEQGRGGRIIGASSIAGKKGWPMLSAYSASKFAIRGLTQNAATELGKYGITVNAYAPGPVDTPMLQVLNETVVRLRSAEEVKVLLEQQASPIGSNGTPEDIAGLVSYLASKESRLVTGQSVSINGGLFFD